SRPSCTAGRGCPWAWPRGCCAGGDWGRWPHAGCARGPELLHMMRTGRRDPGTSRLAGFGELPRQKQFLVGVCMTLCPVALFPQGIVPGVFKVTGMDSRAWFLALYLPPWTQWPVIAVMVALGVALGVAGLRLMQQDRRPGQDAAEEAAGS